MILGVVTVLVLTGFLCFYRIIVGPTVPDRIAAADAIGILLAMVLVLLSAHYRLEILLDVALVYAVLHFADVLILAKFFERGELHR